MEEGMTPEQKAVAMQFMGQTYGQAHKQDQMIIGQTGNLAPNSGQLKEVFEQTARLPTVAPREGQQQMQQQQMQQQQQQQQQQAPQPVAPVTPEQAAQELNQQVNVPPPVDNNQLDLDFSDPAKIDTVISLIQKQNLILKEISLKLDNGKPVKTNKQK